MRIQTAALAVSALIGSVFAGSAAQAHDRYDRYDTRPRVGLSIELGDGYYTRHRGAYPYGAYGRPGYYGYPYDHWPRPPHASGWGDPFPYYDDRLLYNQRLLEHRRRQAAGAYCDPHRYSYCPRHPVQPRFDRGHSAGQGYYEPDGGRYYQGD